jgi:hypothetical protein
MSIGAPHKAPKKIDTNSKAPSPTGLSQGGAASAPSPGGMPIGTTSKGGGTPDFGTVNPTTGTRLLRPEGAGKFAAGARPSGFVQGGQVPIVRDHRSQSSVVRDHRSPIVRDHRSQGSVVRDHRSLQQVVLPAPGCRNDCKSNLVRDHRGPKPRSEGRGH